MDAAGGLRPVVEVVNEVQSTIKPNDHPYMTGAWQPMYREVNSYNLEVLEGKVPQDICGIYIRNTENPVHEPIGRYHPFDGDGMLHQVVFDQGKATYRNRFIRTKSFLMEQEVGASLWAGLAENPAKSKRPGWGAQGSLKCSSSTDVVVHAGKVLTTFYQCGDAYRLDLETLEQLGPESWDGLFPSQDGGISAHAKVDDETGDLLFFNYSKEAPYMHYGVVNAKNKLVHYIPVPLPGPRLPHDMMFSKNYSILNDFPLFWDEKLLKKNVHANRFHEHLPSRFAVVPRFGQTSDIRWFESSPTFVLHWVNAYEDVDVQTGHSILILDGYRQRCPMPDSNQPAVPDVPEGYRRMMVYLDFHAMQPQLWRWQFDLVTGKTTDKLLDSDATRFTEFGVINPKYTSKKYRYVYSSRSKPGWFLLSGLTRHDLLNGTSQDYDYGLHRYGSEPVMVPRQGARLEDDGYIITYVTDMASDSSEVLILDAQTIGNGPICRLKLPHRIPSGTHATWSAHPIKQPRVASKL